MAEKMRSPKYPIVGLKDAIDKLTALYGHIKTATADNDVAARAWGYSGKKICGPALQVISTLTQFGLIERASVGKIKISELGLDILLPQTPNSKINAIYEAATNPTIFRELENQYPKELPSDDTIKAYLIRRSSPYTEEAAIKIIKSFKETQELLNLPEMNLVENKEEKLLLNKETSPSKPSLVTSKDDFVLSFTLFSGKNATLTISGGTPSRMDIDFIKKLLGTYEDNLPTKEPKTEEIPENE